MLHYISRQKKIMLKEPIYANPFSSKNLRGTEKLIFKKKLIIKKLFDD